MHCSGFAAITALLMLVATAASLRPAPVAGVVKNQTEVPKALAYPNNVNTIVQRDSFGDAQNIAYYDSDSGLFIGPGADPRTTIYANVPINLFRRQATSCIRRGTVCRF